MVIKVDSTELLGLLVERAVISGIGIKNVSNADDVRFLLHLSNKTRKLCYRKDDRAMRAI